MARSEDRDDLRACPTCGTEVAEAKLGMRDYSRWLSSVLPGRVSGSDVDTVLEQAKTGRMLAIEFKRKGQLLPTGQRLLLKALVKRGVDVWVAWEETEHVEVGVMTDDGEVLFVQRLTIRQFGQKARAWWDAGLED